MLYAQSHQLGFIHIPKCAGISIVRTLEDVASFPEAAILRDLPELHSSRIEGWSEHIVRHPKLGDIHLAHLPLPILQEHFPATWSLFHSASTFAIVRDPRSRFVSALMQRMREFKGYGATGVRPEDLQREAVEVISWIDKRRVFADLQYIHFSRQSDYVDLSDRRVVTAVFPIERLDALRSWLGETFGLNDLRTTRSNASLAPHKSLQGLHRRFAPTYRAFLPKQFRAQIFETSKRFGLLEQASSNYANLSFSNDVESFIEAYYKKDQDIHRAALAAWSA